MKNFSAKNAEFETLKINNEAAISSADLGTAPNQIPLNKDLGSLAYQDAVNLDDVSADMLELRAIAAEISDSAVDVFVYDTGRDSDGGAWRKRTQHTSWYNEELNTATRGARREFPAVAVIVAEAGKVTIYDGDDPDMGMWMVFSTTWGFGGIPRTCCVALNGKVVVGSSGWGVPQADFIKDTIDHQWTAGVRTLMSGGIINRNIDSRSSSDDSQIIVNSNANDVAMTILPNAPIDEDTGLPVPTIAVATDGGVSVIKDDGTVVDIVSSQGPTYNYSRFVSFDNNNKLLFGMDQSTINTSRRVHWHDIPSSDKTIDINGVTSELYTTDATNSDVPDAIGGSAGSNDQSFALDGAVAGSRGLTKVERSDNRFAFITYKYNTGWMPGDIKLATLSDTTVGNIGAATTELITNGDFSTDSDWTKGTGWSISGGVALKIGSDNTSILQDINTIAGKNYVVSFQIVSGTENAGAKLYVGEDLVADNLKDPQTVSVNFVATDNSTEIGINGGSFNGGSIDNISVRATTELITNGDFSTDSDWTKGAGWTISGGVASISSSTAESDITQEVYVEAGKVYAFEAELINHTNGIFGISWANGTAALTSVNDVTVTRTSDGQFLRYLKASSSGTFTLSIYVGGGSTGSVDNVSFREVELDRSVNNNGLQIIGEINKTPVAPGADLVAYSGFSENNYLVQPYNEDLNFGTGDFCVMGWFKSYASSNAGIIYSRRPQSSNINGLEIGVTTDGTLYVYTIEDSVINSSSTPLSGKPITRNVWNNFCAVRSGETINLYVNGVLHSSTTNTIRNLTNPSAELCLGVYGDQSSFAFNGEISLIRVSATVPTDAQIAKIYRDEKALFTDGAQATLYGTSDAVTALAYDEKTELLHVGTASGRSDFSGLRRINNTTTAITTSISAHNNLIAEQ